MHALLALAASRLTLTSQTDYTPLALAHRLRAIQGLNRTLSRIPQTTDGGDALLAACYALTFQSQFLKDGISEFLTMVRGCGLVSIQLEMANVPVSFSITLSDHWDFMETRLDNLPDVDSDLFEGSLASLEALLPLCEGHDIKISFHRALSDCAEAIRVDTQQGRRPIHHIVMDNTNNGPAYYQFITIYGVLYQMDDRQFQLFTNPIDDINRLLLAHSVALQIILAPILERERQGRMMSTPIESLLDWLDKIKNEVSPSLQGCLRWPSRISKCLRTELQQDQPQRQWFKTFPRIIRQS
jgi:hypothetical protein